jgi:peptide/nickel transport system substrate-binding protein
VQAQAKEIGIDVHIQPREAGALFADVQAGRGEASVFGWGGRTDPDGNVFPMFHTRGGWNGGKYANPAVDELIEHGRSVSDQTERRRVYAAIQARLNQDVAFIFTTFRPTLQAARADLRGYQVMPDQVLRLSRAWRARA